MCFLKTEDSKRLHTLREVVVLSLSFVLEEIRMTWRIHRRVFMHVMKKIVMCVCEVVCSRRMIMNDDEWFVSALNF